MTSAFQNPRFGWMEGDDTVPGVVAAKSVTGAKEAVVIAGRYRLEKKLGEGGMGQVFEATDLVLERRVALKLVRPDLPTGVNAKTRFLSEAKRTAQIDHLHIVKVHDVGFAEDGAHFYAMELLQGSALKELLDREKTLSATRAVEITLQILDGLETVHAAVPGRGAIVHRDLKPSNIILVKTRLSEDLVKIIDFGIAKSAEGDEPITLTGLVAGTPGYMAPEYLLNPKTPVHPTMDLFAVGVMLYEMLGGRRAAKDQLGDAFLHMIQNKQTSFVPADDSSIPLALARIAAKATALDPAVRYQSAKDFKTDLLALRHLHISEVLSGTVIDDAFRLSEKLGEGGFGVVYKAMELTTSELFAIKFLHTPFLPGEDDVILRRFHQEAQLASKIDHPAIVKVVRVGSWHNHPFLVMEYVRGTTLGAMLQTMAWPRFIEILGRVAEGLEQLHARDIVHRDINPDNIMITTDGQPKILDLGLAHALDRQITSSGVQIRLGRMGFISPEQASEPSLVGPASDQWSLAAIVHQKLFGVAPSTAIQDNLLAAEPRAPIEKLAEIRKVLAHALAEDPAARFPSISDFVGALSEAGGVEDAQPNSVLPAIPGNPISATSSVVVTSGVGAATRMNRHWPWKWAILGAAAILILVFSIFGTRTKTDAVPPMRSSPSPTLPAQPHTQVEPTPSHQETLPSTSEIASDESAPKPSAQPKRRNAHRSRPKTKASNAPVLLEPGSGSSRDLFLAPSKHPD